MKSSCRNNVHVHWLLLLILPVVAIGFSRVPLAWGQEDKDVAKEEPPSKKTSAEKEKGAVSDKEESKAGALQSDRAGEGEKLDVKIGTEANRDLFANFMHNAVIGKFDRADNYAKALLARNPDPLEIMAYSDEQTNSLKTLMLLIENVQISDSAQKVIALIHQGELLVRKDPERIKLNIDKLGGDPQTEFNAINRLRESGEYAVPWLVSTLQDKTREKLHQRIIRMLPRMGKEAVNPLVISLKMNDDDTKQFVIRALGEIGYPQAVPYLLAVCQDPRISPELRKTVDAALNQLGVQASGEAIPDAGDAYVDLARQYYEDQGSVKADPRFDFANVWYWQDGRLDRTEVPRIIFDEIMAMRCCEESLKLKANNDPAIAYWLAADIRRESQLGMDVESTEQDRSAVVDPTKIENFPRSTYFARTAGSKFDQMVLGLAIKYREPPVALGAVATLRLIAGADNLVGTEDDKQPLTEALTFPDLVVRIKAALTLAHALPREPFKGSDRVVPILAETLAQTGGRFVLVIEPDEANLNRVMGALRNEHTTVIGEAQVLSGMERARRELPSVSAVFLATDVSNPTLVEAINALRSNHVFELAPIVLLTKKAQADQAADLDVMDEGIVTVPSNGDPNQLTDAWNTCAKSVGQTALGQDQALTLALDAVDALHKIAFSHSKVYDFSQAETALIRVLDRPEEVLQVAAVNVLALSGSSSAQQAVARVALNERNTESLRLVAFNALAESAKMSGRMLTEDLTNQLIKIALDEPNLTIRSAASQALGALNLPSNKSGQVIDKYYRG